MKRNGYFEAPMWLLRCAAVAVALSMATPASALTIVPTWDASITSRADAATIKAAFVSVANRIAAQFTSPATVNINVSWGKVGSSAMPAGYIGGTSDQLYGYFTFAQIKSYVANAAQANPGNTPLVLAAANLPAIAPSGVTRYVIPFAQAKALGVVPAGGASTDAFMGFAANVAFDYDPSNGITPGAYNFQSVVANEIGNALGRLSGLYSTAPDYRTVFDLLRYKAPGVLSFSIYEAAYFSIDGGRTNLGAFNNASSGDHGDWLYTATSTDVEDAVIVPGQHRNLTAVDLTALDALGYANTNVGNTAWQTPQAIVIGF